jgi:hypothetical protein
LCIVRDITALAHIANAASSMCLRKRRLRPEQVKSSPIPLTPLLGLAAQYTGLRTTSADPTGLVKGRDRLRDALADVVHHYVEHDGAQAVITRAVRSARPRANWRRCSLSPSFYPFPQRHGPFLRCWRGRDGGATHASGVVDQDCRGCAGSPREHWLSNDESERPGLPTRYQG